ncbi:MAG: hypothetical protein H7Y17_03375, partial [Chlorobia bacterium]|nr:hypothetical protein [Fimbriimonadaceae bacterium]
MTLVALSLIALTNPLAGVEVYTSTQQVTSMAQDARGTLWVGTRGGVLCIDAQNQIQRFSRLDGLPSHEIQSVSVIAGKVSVSTPLGGAVWSDGKWVGAPQLDLPQLKLPSEPPEGLYVSDVKRWNGRDYAAAFGSGVWVFEKGWKKFEPAVSIGFQDVTALTFGTRVAIGSNRNGVATLEEGKWSAVKDQGPPSLNVQAIQLVGDEMVVATLDQGLWALQKGAWRQVPSKVGRVPRQILPGTDSVWVRHGTGAIESMDILAKTPSADLPRKQATSLDRRDGENFVSYWGGFSVQTKGEWAHFGTLAELKGFQTTAIVGDSNEVLLGTQNAGLYRFGRSSGVLTHIDAGLKLGDDWVTCLAKDGNRTWIGTFV